MIPFAQIRTDFWTDLPGSSSANLKIIVGLLVGIGVIFALLRMSTQFRRPLIVGSTFIAGLYYILLWLWPKPIDRDPGEVATNPVEGLGFWLEDANPAVSQVRNIIAAFLIGLGVYSLLRIHVGKIAKQQKDWGFSLVLLVSMFGMAGVGFADWASRQGPEGAKLDNQANWGAINYVQDFLFDGLLQQMDAAMFSLIAFYILSAAYRAFRARSVEATILLGTAMILMLSLLGGISYLSDQAIEKMGGTDPNAFINNFRLTELAGWIQNSVQVASIRGLQFGIGIGLLALALRLWLSLEKMGNA